MAPRALRDCAPSALSAVGAPPLNFTVRRLNVPRYEVTVQGRGIAVPMQTSLAVGFLRLVHVSANDPVEAEKQAIGLVKSEWDSSDYASTDRGGPPHLTINTVGVLSWIYGRWGCAGQFGEHRRVGTRPGAGLPVLVPVGARSPAVCPASPVTNWLVG